MICRSVDPISRMENAPSSNHNTSAELTTDRVTVCVCTFKRPGLLREALCGIAVQEKGAKFLMNVVVIDNDIKRSAENVVTSIQNTTPLDILYACEPQQNISLARNKAVCEAQGNLIAFLDDDEVPEPTWLLRLYDSLNAYKVDGVLGPVLPRYGPGHPSMVSTD